MATPAATLLVPAVVGGVVGGVAATAASRKFSDFDPPKGSSGATPSGPAMLGELPKGPYHPPPPTTTIGTGLPPQMGTDDRIECFRLGARIHDHVSDMQEAIEETDEAKPSDRLGVIGAQWFTALNDMFLQELKEARQKGCLPSDVEELTLFQYGPGDPEFREELYRLGVKLGDPPLLRNLRRIEETRGEK